MASRIRNALLSLKARIFFAIVAAFAIGLWPIAGAHQNADSSAAVVQARNGTHDQNAREMASVASHDDHNSDSNVDEPSIESILKLNGFFERHAKIYRMLESAEESQVIEIINEIAEIELSPNGTTFPLIAFARLASLNPQRALELIDRFEPQSQPTLLVVTFQTWALKDIESALEAAKELEKHKKSHAAVAILGSGMHIPASIRNEVLNQLGQPALAGGQTMNSPVTERTDNPRREWDSLLDSPDIESVDVDTLADIAFRRYLKEGKNILSGVHDARLKYQTRQAVEKALRERIAFTDPSQDVDGRRDEPENKLPPEPSIASLVAWASFEPEAAFVEASKLDEKRSTTSHRRVVLSVWVKREPMKILNLIDTLPEGLANDFQESAIAALLSRGDVGTPEFLTRIENVELRRRLVKEIVLNWMQSDARAASDWLLEQHYFTADDHVIRAVVHEAAMSHPREALYIMSSCTGQFATNLERWNFSKVAKVDPDAAIEYLPNLRGYMVEHGYFVVACEMLRSDLPRAMQLGYELDSEAQKGFYEKMSVEIKRVGVEVAIDMVDHFPTQDMTSRAAFIAIWEFGKKDGELTEEQFRHFYKRLNEKHRETIDEFKVSQQWNVR